MDYKWNKKIPIGSSSIDASSLLDINSTTGGSRPFPQMTEAQRDAIVSPANGLMVYNTDTDALNQYNLAGTSWAEVSGSGGQGGINYILNPDIETGLDDITVTNDITLALETTDPLRGDQSAKFVTVAVQSGADYIEFNMNDVDNQDIGKALYISFDYYCDANVSTDDFQVVLYNNDSANDVLVRGGNGSGKLVASIGKTRFTGVAYLDPTDNSYSLRLNVLSAPSSDSSLYIDNVIVGPQSIVDAPIVSDWEAFTPTGTWTSNVTYSGVKRRVGDSVEIQYKAYLTGAPNSVQLKFDMPPGLTLDDTKLKQNANESYRGIGQVSDPGTGLWPIMAHASATNAKITPVVYNHTSGSYSKGGGVTQVVPTTFGSGDAVLVSITVPVEEWANSSAVLSTKEMLNQVTTAKRSTDAAQSIPNAIATIIDYEDLDWSDGGGLAYTAGSGYTAGTGVWTVDPIWTANKKMKLQISAAAMLATSATWAEAELMDFIVAVNGSNVSSLNRVNGLSGTEFHMVTGTTIIELEKGDYFNVNLFQSSGGALALYNSGQYNHISLTELPDFSVYSVYPEPLKTQTKYLTSNFTSGTAVTDLTFSNLTVGQWYRADCQFIMVVNDGTGDPSIDIRASHDSIDLSRSFVLMDNGTTTADGGGSAPSFNFQATASTLIFTAVSVSVDSYLEGSSDKLGTFVVLSEIQPQQETTEW